MKKLLLLAAASLLFSINQSFSQTGSRTLKKILELKIPREGGANGASVVWHPVQKKYYAAMAGNVDFSISVFDVKGTRLSPVSQKAMFDIRGLWYNPATKTIQMNGYDTFGWSEYKLDLKGLPVSVKNLHEGMNQPDAQSAGAFNPLKNEVYFLGTEGEIDVYGYKWAEHNEYITIHLGVMAGNPDDVDLETNNSEVIEDYNTTTVIYTGIKGAEIGLLNYINKEVELYNKATGFLTKKLQLPEDAPATDWLNFAYTNGTYWLFDTEVRIWKGYK
ncbi:MAG: hypothetical protein IPH18_06950 [Chitinophagaceae bacterium]|nr:hypothetical protein [Chitinophagaceae bacterium]MBK8951079.1 hypothetical protein [Chitinophagaceae bacterium]